MKNRFFLLIAFMMLMQLLAMPAARALTCTTSTVYPVTNDTVTLNGSYYAGNDIPVGTIIYQTRISSSHDIGISCNPPKAVGYSYNYYYAPMSEPQGSATSMSVSGVGEGYVYPTNSQGIGIVFWEQSSFSAGHPAAGGEVKGNSGVDYGTEASFNFALVKTGPVSSGAEISANSIPQIKVYVDDPDMDNSPITMWTISFGGSVHFTSQTCQTPDLTVDMGKYEIAEHFTGIGSVTPWIDSSIQLLNCPAFTGYYGYSDEGQQSISGSGTPAGGTLTNNIIRVSLQPTTDVVDPENGVIAVNADGSAGSPAVGIGLQFGYTPDNVNASPTSPSDIWHSGDSWTIIPPGDGTANFRIPLSARYFQYGKVVSPGPANAQAVFIIDYN